MVDPVFSFWWYLSVGRFSIFFLSLLITVTILESSTDVSSECNLVEESYAKRDSPGNI